MNAIAQPVPGGPLRRASDLLYTRRGLLLLALLAPPLLWFGVVYLGWRATSTLSLACRRIRGERVAVSMPWAPGIETRSMRGGQLLAISSLSLSRSINSVSLR